MRATTVRRAALGLALNQRRIPNCRCRIVDTVKPEDETWRWIVAGWRRRLRSAWATGFLLAGTIGTALAVLPAPRRSNVTDAIVNALLGVAVGQLALALGVLLWSIVASLFERQAALLDEVKRLHSRLNPAELDIELEGLEPSIYTGDGNCFLGLRITNHGPPGIFTAWVREGVRGVRETNAGGLYLGWLLPNTQARDARIGRQMREDIYAGAYLRHQERFRFHKPGYRPGRWEVDKSLHPISDIEFELDIFESLTEASAHWTVVIPFDPAYTHFLPMRPTRT